jgi:hypothetical protein
VSRTTDIFWGGRHTTLMSRSMRLTKQSKINKPLHRTVPPQTLAERMMITQYTNKISSEREKYSSLLFDQRG